MKKGFYSKSYHKILINASVLFILGNELTLGKEITLKLE